MVILLVAMGYGGSLQDAGKAVGKAGDEGIDGIIKEDKLGLDTVYIQDARMATWLSSIGADDRVVTCTIARGEILFGLERLAPGRRRTELDGKARQLFAAVPCEPIPPSAGDVYANPFSANRCSSSAILETPTRQQLQLGSQNPRKRV